MYESWASTLDPLPSSYIFSWAITTSLPVNLEFSLDQLIDGWIPISFSPDSSTQQSILMSIQMPHQYSKFI